MRPRPLHAALLLCACGAVRFDVEQSLPQQTVKGGGVLGGVLPAELLGNATRFTIDLKSEVQRRGTGPATKARLKSLTLQVTPHAAPQGNFDFLDEVHLFVEGPGLPKLEVAKAQPVPRSRSALAFDVVPDVDLLPYVNAGATITATASGRAPAMDTSFDGQVVVEVQL